MKKAAMFCSTGFEEGETLLVTDILRRAEIEVDLVSIEDKTVTSGHAITVIADHIMEGTFDDYDMVIVPGGGAERFKACAPLIALLQRFAEDETKLVAGICSGLRVLAHAGILTGRKMTYTPNDMNKALFADAEFIDKIVVQDGRLITSRAPGMSFAFGFALVQALGQDAEALSTFMQYPRACKG